MKARIRFITVGILLAVFTAFSGSFMQWALGYGYTKDNPAGREKVAVHDEVAAAYQVEVTDAVVTAEAIRAASFWDCADCFRVSITVSSFSRSR